MEASKNKYATYLKLHIIYNMQYYTKIKFFKNKKYLKSLEKFQN